MRETVIGRAVGTAVKFSRLLLCGCLLAAVQVASAHHNFNAIFEMERYEILDLTVTSIRWTNPHVLIRGDTETGDSWTVETGPVNVLARSGVSTETLVEGDRVMFRGNPSRAGRNLLWLRNMLTPEGQEILFANGQPYWGAGEDAQRVGSRAALSNSGRADDEITLFRVWGSLGDGPNSSYRPQFNETAGQIQASYERPEGFDCMPPGMPRAFNQRHPIEFIDQGDRMLLRGEEFDAERIIWLTPPEEAPEPSLYGYSVGTLDGNVLTIETTRIDYPRFTVQGPYEGMPMSPDARVVETYRLVDDGLNLEYESTLYDEMYLAEPFYFAQTYMQVPGLEILPWACIYENE